MATASILGIKKVIFLGEEDSTLENTNAFRKKLVKIIREQKPDLIFCFDPANKTFDRAPLFHRDHRAAAEAVFDAVYPEAGCDVFHPDLMRKGCKPHTIEELWCFGTAAPNRWIDISSTLQNKIQAILQHKSQISNPRELIGKVRKWAATSGRKKHMKYAEQFRVIPIEP